MQKVSHLPTELYPFFLALQSNYCLLSTSLVPPLKWRINCCPTFRGNGDIRYRGRGAGRGVRASANGMASRRHNHKQQKPFSGSLKKPPNRFSPHPRSWESQRCHPSCSEFTVCSSSVCSIPGLVKAGTWKNDIKPLQDCHLICHGTRSYTYLAWRLWRKTRTGGEKNSRELGEVVRFRGLFAKGKFLFQLSRKYVGVASDSFPAGKSQVFQDLSPPLAPQVYVNRSCRKHMFIIWDSPAAYNDFAAGGWGNTFAVRRFGLAKVFLRQHFHQAGRRYGRMHEKVAVCMGNGLHRQFPPHLKVWDSV